MDLKNKRIILTGGGGFIGSHLLEQLLLLNCEVTAFLHYNSFNRWGWIDYLPERIKSAIKVFTGDIRDQNGVLEAMKGNEIVFHLAALIGIPYSYHSPDTYVDTNIKGTLNVLQAARRLEIEKVVHTSTSEVYGTAQFVPITEEHPINPQSPYAATKSGADFLALTFHRSFKTPVVIVRPFNTFGPRQSSRAVIPTIITQILSGKKEIALGSIHPTRDLCFVKDTVSGFIKASESDEIVGQVVNLGTKSEISIGDLAIKIAELMEKEVEIISSDQRIRPDQSEVERLFADNSKAIDFLQWSPQVSLEDGLKATIEWFSNPNNLAMYKTDIYNI